MKLVISVLLFSLLPLAFGETETAKINPDTVRKSIIPYLTVVEKDETHLKVAKEKIDLGRVLFFDKRLSGKSNISCNSCHDLKNYGTNGEHYKKQREEGTSFRDVPSIYNLSNFNLFNWDGSQKTLEAQTAAALKNEYEMNTSDPKEIVTRLKGVPAYEDLFKKAFPDSKDPVSVDNLVKALAEFQKGLVTVAPIDVFLKGDNKALSEKQLKGAQLFDEKSCFACHTGGSFGGQMIIKLGIAEPWPNQKDQGHFHISKDPKHKMTFRVSPLRNIEKTAPYFHDASAKRMWSAIRTMSHYELGQYMSVEEILSIQEFFKSLTGKLPEEYIKEPKVP